MSMFSMPSSNDGGVAAVTVCLKGYRLTTTCGTTHCSEILLFLSMAML